MDRFEKRRRKSDFANEPEIAERDRPVLDTPQGREPGAHRETLSPIEQELQDKTAGTQPRSAVTDNADRGGDEETPDGLNAQDEALRRAVEDQPLSEDTEDRTDSLPVFDRGETPPKT